MAIAALVAPDSAANPNSNTLATCSRRALVGGVAMATFFVAQAATASVALTPLQEVRTTWTKAKLALAAANREVIRTFDISVRHEEIFYASRQEVGTAPPAELERAWAAQGEASDIFYAAVHKLIATPAPDLDAVAEKLKVAFDRHLEIGALDGIFADLNRMGKAR